MNWYLKVLGKYAVFNGRARRKEYWMFFLFNNIISFILELVEGFAGIAPNIDQSVFAGLYGLAMLIPSLAVGARRLHDTDLSLSGWWQLIVFIPIIGPIVLLVFMVQDSQPGKNKYGPNPKRPKSLPNSQLQ